MVVADDGIATLAGCIREDRLGRDREASPGERAGDVFEAILRRECAGVAAALRRRRARRSVARDRADPSRASGSGRATASFASAMPPARRIRSSARASAWRSSRRSCSPPCSGPERPCAASTRDSRGRGAGDAAARVRGALAAALRAAACASPRPSPTWRCGRAAVGRRRGRCVRAWPGLLTHGARWSGKTRCRARGGRARRARRRRRARRWSRSAAEPQPVPRSAAWVAASAGRKVSSASSDSSTSFGVPNTVVVLMNDEPAERRCRAPAARRCRCRRRAAPPGRPSGCG